MENKQIVVNGITGTNNVINCVNFYVGGTPSTESQFNIPPPVRHYPMQKAVAHQTSQATCVTSSNNYGEKPEIDVKVSYDGKITISQHTKSGNMTFLRNNIEMSGEMNTFGRQLKKIVRDGKSFLKFTNSKGFYVYVSYGTYKVIGDSLLNCTTNKPVELIDELAPKKDMEQPATAPNKTFDKELEEENKKYDGNIIEVKKEDECSLCMEREGRMALIPCGHSGYCVRCATNMLKQKKCAVCPKTVDTLLKLFPQ